MFFLHFEIQVMRYLNIPNWPWPLVSGKDLLIDNIIELQIYELCIKSIKQNNLFINVVKQLICNSSTILFLNSEKMFRAFYKFFWNFWSGSLQKSVLNPDDTQMQASQMKLRYDKTQIWASPMMFNYILFSFLLFCNLNE